MKKIFIGIGICIILVAALFYGCGKVVQEGATGGGGGGGGQSGLAYSPATPTIAGVVSDSVTGNPIQGVTVTVVGSTSASGVRARSVSAQTNSTGNFILTGVSANTNIIRFEKTGYYAYSQFNLPVTSHLVVNGSASLKKFAYGQSVTNVAVNNTISDPASDASITIPAGNLSGPTTVNLTPFEGGSRLFPGSYMDSTGQTIKSYGFINVEGVSNFSNAQMSIPTDASAANTSPVYVFDNVASTWVLLSGVTATKIQTTNGYAYQFTIPANAITTSSIAGAGSRAASVQNYSTYVNCDTVATTSGLSGRVIDQSGNAIESARVYGYGQRMVTDALTNSQGIFNLRVEGSSTVNAKVDVLNTTGAEQDNIATAPVGQTIALSDPFIIYYPDLSTVNQMDVTPILNPAIEPEFSAAVAPAGSGRTLDVVTDGANNSLNYFTYDGSNWAPGSIVYSYLAVNPTIRITSDGKPKICFWSSSDNSLYYAYQSGANWVKKQIVQAQAAGENIYYSFVLDKNNKPHVFYYTELSGMTSWDIREISSDDEVNWTTPALITTSNKKINGNSLSAAIGPNNERAIVYNNNDSTAGETDYCNFVQFDTTSSSWGTPQQICNFSSAASGIVFASKLLFSSAGQPIVAVLSSAGNATGGFLSSIQIFKFSAHTWNASNVVSGQDEAYTAAFDFALDNNGNPLITYNDTIYPRTIAGTASTSIVNMLKYAAFNGSIWKFTDVDFAGASNAVILVGSDNAIRIFYQTLPLTGQSRTKLSEFIPKITID